MMKKYLTFVLLIILFSCKKDNTNSKGFIITDINGASYSLNVLPGNVYDGATGGNRFIIYRLYL